MNNCGDSHRDTGENPPAASTGAERSETDEDHPDLAREPEQEPGPHRRSPWNRRRDRVAVAVLTLVGVTAGVLVWSLGDSTTTSQQTRSEPPGTSTVPASVPATLTEAWSAPSSATTHPVSAGDTVVTGEDGRVQGRDPATGEERWHYGRDLDLCTVTDAWSTMLALHRKNDRCSEVTQLDPGTGQRTAQRNGNAELDSELIVGGGHVTTTGDHLLNTWRNDLVKSMEYGHAPTPVKPDAQPREDCEYGTVAATDEAVGVIEHCPDETGARLTVLQASGEESDEPEQEFSELLPETSAVLVAMSTDAVAIALPEQQHLRIYDREGHQVDTHALDVSTDDLAAQAQGDQVPTTSAGDQLYWSTGASTIALSSTDLTPEWTLDDTRGPGTRFAGQYVLPTDDGIAVVEEETGAVLRTVDVDRPEAGGQIRTAAVGPVLLEQREDTVVALT